MSGVARGTERLGAAVGLLQGSELREEEALCINVRGRGQHCNRCAAACHVGALAPSPDAVTIDPGRCTGCGACVPVCPAGVLRLTGFSPARFLAALGGEATAHLHCSASQDTGGGIVIACFKLLDERLLAAARATGVKTFLLHGLERCAGCRHGGAVREIERTTRRLVHRLGEAAPTLSPAGADDARADPTPAPGSAAAQPPQFPASGGRSGVADGRTLAGPG